jgi:hypothetical protein
MAEILQRIGIDTTISRMNVAPDRVDHRSVYTEETQAIVAQVYRRDIEIFGYAFDGEPQVTRVHRPSAVAE